MDTPVAKPSRGRETTGADIVMAICNMLYRHAIMSPCGNCPDSLGGLPSLKAESVRRT